MTLNLRTLVAMAILLCGSPVGCAYDPKPADGAQACSAKGECPEGYSCRPTGTCFSDGLVSDDKNDYLGMWAFGITSTVEAICNDGSPSTTMSVADRPGSPSIMNITPGPKDVAALKADWLCSLNLDVTGAGARLGSNTTTKCSLPRADNAPTSDPLSLTWTTTKFDVKVRTNDRMNASHSGDYTRVDTYADGHLVTCSQKVRGVLKKL